MKKILEYLEKNLSPQHSLAILVIVIGFVIAIVLDGWAFTLIGLSIAVLGGIGIFMLMAQQKQVPDRKKSRTVPLSKKSSKGFIKSFGADADYKSEGLGLDKQIPVQKERENYPDKFLDRDEGFRIVKDGEEDSDFREQAPPPPPSVQKEPDKPAVKTVERFSDTDYEGDDAEGFRIVPKGEAAIEEPEEKSAQKQSNAEYANIIKSRSAASKTVKQEQNPTLFDDSDFEFEDEFSGMRILGPEPERNSTASEKPADNDEESDKNDKKSKNQRKKDIQSKKKIIKQKSREFKKKRRENFNTQLSDNPYDSSPMPSIKEIEELKNDLPGIPTTHAGYNKKEVDIPISMLMELNPPSNEEPRLEFDYFLRKVLKIIMNVAEADTAVFFMYNADKKEMIIESQESEKNTLFLKNRKLPLGNDIISSIIKSEKPEVLSDINPKAEKELIPYYTGPASVSSFIGVPVFFRKAIIGVLCADSEKADRYDSETISLFTNFTKLISSNIRSYTDKYDLIQASRTLEAISLFRKIVSDKEFTIDDIHDSVIQAASRLFEKPSVGICAYDEETGGWVLKKYLNRLNNTSNIEEGTSVQIENTLIGKAIISCTTVFDDKLKSDTVRLYKEEDDLRDGFFVAVPMKSFSNNYGSLFVQADNNSSFTSYDMEILETLGEHAGASIEQMLFIEMLQSSSLVDNTTGLLNPPAFYSRLDEELGRLKDRDETFSLCLFRIDRYESFDPDKYSDRADMALYHVMKTITKRIKDYDVFGRIEANIFGLILIGKSTQKAKVWAEKIRREIAASPIEIQNHKFSITISIGIAEPDSKSTVENSIHNCIKVLDKASAESNAVHTYG